MANLETLMSTTPGNLASQQERELVSHLHNVLDAIHVNLTDGNYQRIINQHTFESAAGDGYGDDNTCINFAYDGGELDIGEAIGLLIKLREVNKDNNNTD